VLNWQAIEIPGVKVAITKNALRNFIFVLLGSAAPRYAVTHQDGAFVLMYNGSSGVKEGEIACLGGLFLATPQSIPFSTILYLFPWIRGVC
jgi:hypothetical protein